MLFICTKIKNVAVAFLVLLVFETTSKKKQKILLCEQSCCCHTLGTRKKLQNPSMRTILLLSRPWNTKKVAKPLYANNLVVITPSEHEKSYKTPLYEQSCCYYTLGTRKKLQNPSIRTILLLLHPWNTKKDWSEKNLALKKF